jgi:hypothetical protein
MTIKFKWYNCLFFLFLSIIIKAQPTPPKLAEETNKLFSELIKDNKLSNFKTGLLCTAQRNDTLFVVFYHAFYNNISYTSLGVVGNTTFYDCYNGETDYHILKLWTPSANACSKFVSKFKINNEENVYIFSQTLTQHHTVKANEDPTLSVKNRTIYYSTKRGIYNIEYSQHRVYDNEGFKWAYMEGDFFFD